MMIKNYGLRLRAWIIGLCAAALATGFLIANINAFNVSPIYLILFLGVVSVGVLTNVWGGLAASGVAVFSLAVLNQFVGIYPVQNPVVNIATELSIFLFSGPASGWLAHVLEGLEQRIRHADSLAEAGAMHDTTFHTLKTEWAMLRLEEEVARARRFERPLSLGVLGFADGSAGREAERGAALQGLIRIARACTSPPEVVSLTPDGRVMLILPEHSKEQAGQILSMIQSRAATEHFFPDGAGSLGKPLQLHGAIEVTAVALRAEHAGAGTLLQDAVAAMPS